MAADNKADNKSIKMNYQANYGIPICFLFVFWFIGLQQ